MKIKFRVWIEKEGKHVIGKGGAEILRAIRDEGSISSASRKLGMSYKYVWSYLRKMKYTVGSVVESAKGGRRGGETKLTRRGEEILSIYESCEKVFGIIAEEKYLDLTEGVVREGVVEIKGDSELKNGEEVLILRKKSGKNLQTNFWSSDKIENKTGDG